MVCSSGVCLMMTATVLCLQLMTFSALCQEESSAVGLGGSDLRKTLYFSTGRRGSSRSFSRKHDVTHGSTNERLKSVLGTRALKLDDIRPLRAGRTLASFLQEQRSKKKNADPVQSSGGASIRQAREFGDKQLVKSGSEQLHPARSGADQIQPVRRKTNPRLGAYVRALRKRFGLAVREPPAQEISVSTGDPLPPEGIRRSLIKPPKISDEEDEEGEEGEDREDRGILFFPGNVIHSFGLAPNTSGKKVVVSHPRPGIASHLSSVNITTPIHSLLSVNGPTPAKPAPQRAPQTTSQTTPKTTPQTQSTVRPPRQPPAQLPNNGVNHVSERFDTDHSSTAAHANGIRGGVVKGGKRKMVFPGRRERPSSVFTTSKKPSPAILFPGQNKFTTTKVTPPTSSPTLPSALFPPKTGSSFSSNVQGSQAGSIQPPPGPATSASSGKVQGFEGAETNRVFLSSVSSSSSSAGGSVASVVRVCAVQHQCGRVTKRWRACSRQADCPGGQTCCYSTCLGTAVCS